MQWITNYVKNVCDLMVKIVSQLDVTLENYILQKDWIQMDAIACMKKMARCVIFFQKKGLYAYLSMFYIIESTSELVAMCGFTWLALKDSGSIVVQAMCLHPVWWHLPMFLSMRAQMFAVGVTNEGGQCSRVRCLGA